MKKLLFLSLILPQFVFAGDGIWLPILLSQLNQKEMRNMGCKLKAEDIYSVNHSSLKDAICQFAGGCTAEVISEKGLLLTNHHCGFEAIQNLSTLEHNYLDKGFWAKNSESEIPCPGLTCTFIASMEDITKDVLNGVTDEMSEKERQSTIDKNINIVKQKIKKESWEEVLIRPFYTGNQYYMFRTVTYKDIRFVGAPPSSIGKFGSDTDNWEWPRHNGDFSMFRIYTDKDNHPAEFNATNKPYSPKYSLTISLKGIKEGDFTLVMGFPGRTDEYLPAVAVDQIATKTDPNRVAIRDRALKIMDGFMRKDPAIKIHYISRYSGIANSWKKWKGEYQGLIKTHAVEKKKEYEKTFLNTLAQNQDLQKKYGKILPYFDSLYKAFEPYGIARDFYLECFVRNTDILNRASEMDGLIKVLNEKGEKGYQENIAKGRAVWEDIYKEYHSEVDLEVISALTEMYSNKIRGEWGSDYIKKEAAKYGGIQLWWSKLFSQSFLTSKEKLMEVLNMPSAEAVAKMKADPVVQLYQNLNAIYVQNISPKVTTLQSLINQNQRRYMEAQLESLKGNRFFPDANSTLRVAYGKVESFDPHDGVHYKYQTYLDGVMEKYVPGDYEFDVDPKLIELYKAKDYGRYGQNGKMPLAFIGTNHTSGGNSGSPALDARGRLIGLNFDRVWEGTMSDINYDPTLCRNIMVDIRYVLFVIDKFAGATSLVNEMKIVE